MHLTPAQYQALKTAILADPILAALPRNSDSDVAIANALNLNATPNFTVWKTSVSVTQIGDNFVGSELAGLTTANQTRLQTIALYSPIVNPSLVDRRAFFDDVFSGTGGQQTRTKLLVLWKRLATRFEKIYAVGTGSDASPATLVIEGILDPQEVDIALNS